MKRILSLIALVALCNPSWCMENQEKPDPLLSALLEPAQRDLRPIITPHLAIINNDAASPLRKLFQKKHDHYATLPEKIIPVHGSKIPIVAKVANLGLYKNKLVVATDIDIQEIDFSTGHHSTINVFKKGSPQTIAQISPNCALVVHRDSESMQPFYLFNAITNEKRDTKKQESNDIKALCLNQPTAMTFSSDSRLLITASHGISGAVAINWYDALTLERLQSTFIPEDVYHLTFSFITIGSLVLSHDDSLLVLHSGNHALTVFDNKTMKYKGSQVLQIPQKNSTYITDICILDDNETILATANDGYTYSHDLKTQETKIIRRLSKDKMERNEGRFISRIYSIKYAGRYFILQTEKFTPPDNLYIFEYSLHDRKHKPLLTKKLFDLASELSIWRVNSQSYKKHSSLAIDKNLNTLAVCCPDKSVALFDSRGFFNTVINRLAKLSFAQQILLHAYDKLLAQGKTPVKIEKNTLEEKLIQWMDPLIKDILLQEKVIELQ